MKQNTLKKIRVVQKLRKELVVAELDNYSGRGGKDRQHEQVEKSKRFEGGQTPISRRMPKLKGFKKINKSSLLSYQS